MTQEHTPVSPPAELLDILHLVRRPLLIAHIAPDGDAIGSLLATGLLLHKMGKDPVMACQDRIPATFRFLPNQHLVYQDVDDGDIDAVISLDSSDPSRMGDIYDPSRYSDLPLIVIDHHITNVRFGTINWVEPETCATAEIVFHLVKAMDVPLDSDLATCILTGMVTDTRGFRTNNTTAQAMSIASTCMAAGASLNEITEKTLNSRSFKLIRLYGHVLDTVQLNGSIISADNTLAMRVNLDSITRADGLVSFILGAHDAQVAVVFTELPNNKIECSLRARPGNDVASIAYTLGGGGHPLAAGCTVEGSLADVRKIVFDLLENR